MIHPGVQDVLGGPKDILEGLFVSLGCEVKPKVRFRFRLGHVHVCVCAPAEEHTPVVVDLSAY